MPKNIQFIIPLTEIYDDIFKEDILKNKENMLDGELFRKNPVYIQSEKGKIHSGISSEEIIISKLKDLIEFMNLKDVTSLIKSAIAHYFFEYIHPFYDGNGRFGRFLFSLYLSRKFDILTGLSLSYSISLNKEKYLKLFLETSDVKNCGEITFFIEGMLEIIELGQESIIKMLEEKRLELNYAISYMKELELNEDEKKILFILIQNYIFSDLPLKNSELMEETKLSQYRLKIVLEKLIEKKLIRIISKRPLSYSVSDVIKKIL